jgi:hypothetical protein
VSVAAAAVPLARIVLILTWRFEAKAAKSVNLP